MSSLAQAGYSQTRKVTATPRQIEAQIFSQIAAEMEAAAGETANDLNMPALAQAIHRNTQLWTALLTDLASENNSFPDELKANLISLGGFSVRHGSKVLAGEAKADSLIDLNRAIAGGLRAATAQAA